jgi:hypothetical protein
MGSQYFVKRDNQVFGPLTSKVIRILAQEGQLKPGDQLGKQPSGPWAPASKAKGLFSNSPESEQGLYKRQIPSSDSASAPQGQLAPLPGAARVPDESASHLAHDLSAAEKRCSDASLMDTWLRMARAFLIPLALLGIGILAVWSFSTSPAVPVRPQAPLAQPLAPPASESAHQAAATEPTIGDPAPQPPAPAGHRLTRPADGRLGPRIKGLQLGMLMSDAENCIRELAKPLGGNIKFPEPEASQNGVVLVNCNVLNSPVAEKHHEPDPSVLTPLGLWSAVLSDRKARDDGVTIAKLWRSGDRLTGFRLIDGVDDAFHSKDLNDQDFLQSLVNSYGIPSLKPGDIESFGEGTMFFNIITSYTYRDPSGWTLTVRIRNPAGQNHGARTISVMKVVGDSELKFD